MRQPILPSTSANQANSRRGPSPQGVYWIGTIPEQRFVSIYPLHPSVRYMRGQLEQGNETGFRHWQVLLVLSRKERQSYVSNLFPGGHWELSRSKAADDYVWKEDTYIEGTRFEYGEKAINRASKTDWDAIKGFAKGDNLDAVPSDVYVRCYNQLSRIRNDFITPGSIERTCHVFWGKTGTGKSRRAWDEAGLAGYPKDPNTKWWCGYRDHESVVIDEFRGSISISHLLRWLDRYPVIVETKGGAIPLRAKTIWITSNLDPQFWYMDIDEETRRALLRRLNITEFS